MISAETILKQVRRIDIKSKWLANHVFAGEYRTAFKGMGMKFKEVREYQPGDDVRFIDWNVTARMGHPYTKIFEEERELSVFLIVDISPSTLFGTIQSKRELIARLLADLSFSAIANNDKVGLILFNARLEKYIPPGKKPEHTEYLLKQFFSIPVNHTQTNLVNALEFLNNITKHKSIVFILSDFIFKGYENLLGITAKRHDVIGLQLSDKMDTLLPSIGWLQVKDLETGKEVLVNTESRKLKEQYLAQYQTLLNNTGSAFKKAGAALLQLQTGQDHFNVLQDFFLQRIK